MLKGDETEAQIAELKAKLKAEVEEGKKKAMEERIIKAIEVLTAAGYIVTAKGE